MSNIAEKLNAYKAYFEDTLNGFFDGMSRNGVPEEPVFSAVRYSVENGGKRIRPILVYLGAEIAGGRKEDVKELAIAIELIHGYSLVHDDLPSMDNDTLRRNKPTTHVKFGEGMAVLTGDAMLNLAYESVLSKENITDKEVKALAYMAKRAGIYGMIGGQCIDIRDNEKKNMRFESLTELYELKTSMLIGAALVSGAIAVGAESGLVSALELYAKNVGIVFQIVDDILDITSTEEILGKNINSDKKLGKLTILDFVTLDEAKEYIEELGKEVRDALKPFGDSADELIELEKYLSSRKK